MRLPVPICDETSNMFNRLTFFLYASVWILICYVVMSGVCSVELYQRSCALSCKVPQARSMLVADLVNTTLKVRPYMTVLYRCDDGSGCCQKDKTCQVKDFEDLQVRFPTFIGEEYVLKTYTIRNHTECSCQSSKNNIKR
ncbi:uncharacterized protein LOC123317580 [Coccinella septempunctata]|uniref:uncharacterized protein LOC123317580 n=1 Tax=Coccinella septempunctata TaxID=41139 RepID=UPI001D071914|nr:uncharacterized protein LOC123317580 [Coccinella septempunctata]